MHLVIINGSPRVQKYSNTDKIINSFVKGFCEGGNTYELYCISNRTEWEKAQTAFARNTEILIAIPLYVENIPGILLEFLETLDVKKEAGTKISFILQGGFAEGCQLRCGEKFLEKLPVFLGCTYGGTLVKGDNFGIRVMEGDNLAKMLKPYEEIGRLFAEKSGFDNEEARAFTGPEVFSKWTQILLQMMFKTFAKRSFKKVAKSWGCTKPLMDRPYKQL
ncbi:MAG: hypothetical protein ACI4ES_09585 [Roseburia sp.]